MKWKIITFIILILLIIVPVMAEDVNVLQFLTCDNMQGNDQDINILNEIKIILSRKVMGR